MAQSDPNKANTSAYLCAGAALLAIIGFATGKHHLTDFTNPAPAVTMVSPSPIVNTPPVSPPATPVSVAVTPPPIVDRTEELKVEVKSAIETADSADSRALATLDVSALQSVYSGEALRARMEIISRFRAANIHQVNTLISRAYDEIQVNADGQSAKVHMTERWSEQKYSNENNELVGDPGPEHDVPQTVYLHKEERGWIITALDFDK